VLGITLAHIANNLMNDLYDTQVGHRQRELPAPLYAAPGAVRPDQPPHLACPILVVNIADLAILVTLTWARGWPGWPSALSGFALSVAYTARRSG